MSGTGEKMKAARLAVGLTQKELAERIGCKQKDISRWESGRPLMAETLKKIASALCCRMDDLI